MIRTVFLDVDNTLMDFNECAHLAMKKTFLEAGIPYREDMFPVFIKTNDELWHEIEKGTLTRDELHQIRWVRVFSRLGIDYDGVAFEKMFLRHLETTPALIPGALELLEYLSKKYTLCLASNASYKPQTKRLAHSGILPFVQHVFISEIMGVSKPKKGFFDICFSEIPDAKPEESIMIGDSLHADIGGAAEYGMKTCWFNFYNQPVPEGLSADYVVSSLDEIMTFL